MVKKLLLLALMATPMVSHAQTVYDRIVRCGTSTCDAPNFTTQSFVEKVGWTAIDVGPNTGNIQIKTRDPGPGGASEPPRSVRIMMRNGATPRNLSIELSATSTNANAANAIIIGDTFNDLSINLNGFNGIKGKDASQICATRVISGQYGADAKLFFQQRRAADPSLNPGRCDRIDLSYMQSFGFTCDDPTYQSVAGTAPVVEVTRLRSKARCTGVLVRDLCVKYKAYVQCTWTTWRLACEKKGCYWTGQRICNSPAAILPDQLVVQEQPWRGWDNFCRSYVGGPNCNDGLVQIYSVGYNSRYNSAVDPGSYAPLDGSIAEQYTTVAYGSCANLWLKIRTESVVKIAYDNTGTDCSRADISIPEDPNKSIPWAYSGMAQEPEFGTETLQCRVNECPVNSTISDLTRNLDVIAPDSGQNGTQQGSGVALVYDAKTINATAVIGQAGAAGQSDLDAPSSTKYCMKKRDYDTDGGLSEFARNPSVSFRRYTWKAITTTGGGNNGVPPAASANTVQVYKKLDSSARYLLGKEML